MDPKVCSKILSALSLRVLVLVKRKAIATVSLLTYQGISVIMPAPSPVKPSAASTTMFHTTQACKLCFGARVNIAAY